MKVCKFGGRGGDLPPLLCQPLVHLGRAWMLKLSPPLHSLLLPLLTPAGGLGEPAGGTARQVPPQAEQAVGTKRSVNGPESVALGLVLTEAEMHLLCVESVLVTWLLWDESLSLLLNNHRKPTFLRYFPHF